MKFCSAISWCLFRYAKWVWAWRGICQLLESKNMPTIMVLVVDIVNCSPQCLIELWPCFRFCGRVVASVGWLYYGTIFSVNHALNANRLACRTVRLQILMYRFHEQQQAHVFYRYTKTAIKKLLRASRFHDGSKVLWCFRDLEHDELAKNSHFDHHGMRSQLSCGKWNFIRFEFPERPLVPLMNFLLAIPCIWNY